MDAMYSQIILQYSDTDPPPARPRPGPGPGQAPARWANSTQADRLKLQLRQNLNLVPVFLKPTQPFPKNAKEFSKFYRFWIRKGHKVFIYNAKFWFMITKTTARFRTEIIGVFLTHLAKSNLPWTSDLPVSGPGANFMRQKLREKLHLAEFLWTLF